MSYLRRRMVGVQPLTDAGLGISIVPEMVIEQNPPCRYVSTAEQQAVRTVGTVISRGCSQPCPPCRPLPFSRSISAPGKSHFYSMLSWRQHLLFFFGM